MRSSFLVASTAFTSLISAACISSGDQTTINNLFSSGGPGTIVQLCPSTTLSITDTIVFTAPNQEISTQGYPTDSTRAIIKIASGNSASTLIGGGNQEGIRILNIQLDGNRPGNGLQLNGNANIEIGGGGNNQVVSHVASKNPRSWSCLHIIGSGNDASPCSNATITFNDIGPCGNEGTDADGNALWADGISLDCTNSLVSGNTVTGSTDGGIVIFGSPGSTITDNTITSSATDRGFGAINMVDNEYSGSYSGVVVTNNRITGQKLFNLGIGMGAYVWSFNDPNVLTGPVQITGNTFSGNIPFPIAINGWAGGLTVTGNDVSAITTPRSSFADASSCVPAIQTLFNANDPLVYYPPGITGPQTLQSNFVAAAGNITNFLCTTPPLPTSRTYTLNSLAIPDNTQFADLPSIIMQFQGDANVVVYNTSNPSGWEPVWSNGKTVSGGCEQGVGGASLCSMNFQGDGNLVTYFNSTPLWSSGTSGVGSEMVCIDEEPWIQILDGSGKVVWDTSDSV